MTKRRLLEEWQLGGFRRLANAVGAFLVFLCILLVFWFVIDAVFPGEPVNIIFRWIKGFEELT